MSVAAVNPTASCLVLVSCVRSRIAAKLIRCMSKSFVSRQPDCLLHHPFLPRLGCTCDLVRYCVVAALVGGGVKRSRERVD